MIVYFGHGRNIYGTEKAEEILGQIVKKYPRAVIINPESIPQNSMTMLNCFQTIYESDIIVITPEAEEMYGFTLHRGQAAELLYAMSLGKKIEVFYP